MQKKKSIHSSRYNEFIVSVAVAAVVVVVAVFYMMIRTTFLLSLESIWEAGLQCEERAAMNIFFMSVM